MTEDTQDDVRLVTVSVDPDIVTDLYYTRFFTVEDDDGETLYWLVDSDDDGNITAQFIAHIPEDE